MPVIIIYLLKLSVSLALVYLFYRLLLYRLTFYHTNRWYLLCYSLLCFFIPFINISPMVEKGRLSEVSIIQYIPSLDSYASGRQAATMCPEPLWFTSLDKWDWMLLLVTGGVLFLFIRLLLSCFSFWRLKRKAVLLSDEGMKLYHVDESIIPFSFGRSVFINRYLHDPDELQEIIRHEFVHVKQRHSFDILCAELLCMLNWYNPFAWLLKAAIRQNLEFIADHKVLAHGVDRKQYQYLLLKVVGNNHFSIAQQFNFSSLKKRIAMMNKNKSAKLHLLRFLFILPLLAVILVSFRKNKTAKMPNEPVGSITTMTDTIPVMKSPNEKGYIINVKGGKGNAKVEVQDKNGKFVESIPLRQWKEKTDYYEDKYGSFPPPPLPPSPPGPPSAPAPPAPMDLPGNVKKLDRKNYHVTVTLKDGTVEEYDLSIEKQKRQFREKYGELPATPEPPVPPVPPVQGEAAMTPVALINDGAGQTVLAPMSPMAAVSGTPITVDADGNIINGDEDILVTITKTTTRLQLEIYIKQMKEKGIDLAFDEIDYDEKGILVSISGRMKSKDGQSNFTATDFNKLILAMVKQGDKTYFKVRTTDKKVTI